MYNVLYESRLSLRSWERYRPSQLRFTHNSIKTDFRDGNSMEETLESILNGNLNVKDIQPMLVMQYRGRPYVVRGNRRLYLYRKLEQHGFLDTVKVEEAEFDEDIFEQMHTTTTAGTVVRLRGYMKDEDFDDVIRRHRSGLVTRGPAMYRTVPARARLESFGWESAGRHIESESSFSDMCRAIAKVLIGLFVVLIVASVFMKKA